mmetsp:Transcript_10560/g.26473  ORF Transcript_10560/g.26473 Transcript_10560/m.26473 type:complete len:212 (-) Transcript_10560:438-1073(-)
MHRLRDHQRIQPHEGRPVQSVDDLHRKVRDRQGGRVLHEPLPEVVVRLVGNGDVLQHAAQVGHKHRAALDFEFRQHNVFPCAIKPLPQKSLRKQDAVRFMKEVLVLEVGEQVGDLFQALIMREASRGGGQHMVHATQQVVETPRQDIGHGLRADQTIEEPLEGVVQCLVEARRRQEALLDHRSPLLPQRHKALDQRHRLVHHRLRLVLQGH